MYESFTTLVTYCWCFHVSKYLMVVLNFINNAHNVRSRFFILFSDFLTAWSYIFSLNGRNNTMSIHEEPVAKLWLQVGKLIGHKLSYAW